MKKLLHLLLHLIPFLSWAQDSNEFLFLPRSNKELMIISHDFYSYGYDKEHNLTSWVAYNLSKSELGGSTSRTNEFIKDPELRVSGQPTEMDYYRSGYDRGHLAPAADMNFSQKTMSESFYFTNVVPQNPQLNRSLWAELEREIRGQALQDDNLYIVTGVLFVGGQNKLSDRVTVPDYLYKIICDYKEPKIKMLAFLIPNESPEKTLKEYMIDVDHLEALTNLNFFAELEDKAEQELEASVDTHGWFVDRKLQPQLSPSVTADPEIQQSRATSVERSTESVRCQGIAKSTGQRCKLFTYNTNGFCHHHQAQVGTNISYPKAQPDNSWRCAATTQKGTRCKRAAESGRAYCWQHP